MYRIDPADSAGQSPVPPRRRKKVKGIGVNALACADSLFVRDRGEMDIVVRTGPLRLITAAALQT